MSDVPATSIDIRPLKRAGLLLIVLGAAEVFCGAYFIWRGIGYSSGFNIFAIIAGVFIYRGSPRWAKGAAWYTAFFAGAIPVALLCTIWWIPGSLVAAVWSFEPFAAIVFCCWTLILFGLTFGVQLALTTGRATEAYPRKPPRPFWRSPLGWIGAALYLIAMLLVAGFYDRYSDRAVAEARDIAGPDYRYFAHRITWFGGDESHIRAGVLAYRDDEFRIVDVSWTEKE